jgi:hypothetical protein
VGGIPLTPPPLTLGLHFFLGVVCASCPREEMRELSSPRSSKQREDVWVVFTPCRLLICINIGVLLD